MAIFLNTVFFYSVKDNQPSRNIMQLHYENTIVTDPGI
jgi:hypothetical protein